MEGPPETDRLTLRFDSERLAIEKESDKNLSDFQLGEPLLSLLIHLSLGGTLVRNRTLDKGERNIFH